MKLLAAAGAGTLALIVPMVALVSVGPRASASELSRALAATPPGLVSVAYQAGPVTGLDPNVLLGIAKVETDWGQARNGRPDGLVPADIRADVAVAALQAAEAAWPTPARCQASRYRRRRSRGCRWCSRSAAPAPGGFGGGGAYRRAGVG
jgi:hypothetical protein